jgi:hypothetical protein
VIPLSTCLLFNSIVVTSTLWKNYDDDKHRLFAFCFGREFFCDPLNKILKNDNPTVVSILFQSYVRFSLICHCTNFRLGGEILCNLKAIDFHRELSDVSVAVSFILQLCVPSKKLRFDIKTLNETSVFAISMSIEQEGKTTFVIYCLITRPDPAGH